MKELGRLLDFSGKTALITGGAREGWVDFDAELEAQSEVWERPENLNTNEDITMMYFTSGTSGYPKMATHDYRYPLGHIQTAVYWQGCVCFLLSFRWRAGDTVSACRRLPFVRVARRACIIWMQKTGCARW